MSNLDPNIMDWDSQITNDGQPHVTLDEGDYNYTVTAFERNRFPGSAKIPACPKASLTLTVVLPDGNTAICKEDLILYRSLEWKIAAFFRSIGMRKAGEQAAYDWNKVIGAQGRAHFKPRAYTVNGEERTANSVDRYLDYDPKFFEDIGWVQQTAQDVVSGNAQTWQNGGF